MKLTTIGRSARRAGTAKQTGKPYDGQTLYCIKSDPEVDGHKTEEVYLNFLSKLEIPEIGIGDLINVSYDKNGFIDEITVLEKSVKSNANLKISSQS